MAAKQQIKALQERLGAIRDVLLDGNQGTYVAIYRQADRPQRQLMAKNQFLGTFPRYALDAQRLLPALQQVYSGWSSLKVFDADLAGVLAMLNQPLPPLVQVAEPLPLRAGAARGAARAGSGDPPWRADWADRQHRQRQEHHSGPLDGAAGTHGRTGTGGWDGSA